MNTERRETRYFFPSDRVVEVIRIVRTILGTELIYSHPVIETVYFTLGPDACYAFPEGVRVRTRRYLTALSNKVVINNQPLFVEIKEEMRDDFNRKQRIEARGVDAVAKLRNGFGQLPRLFAYAATQSKRLHWEIESVGRLTVDADVRLFGFTESNPCEGRYICDYGEGKLEFKLTDIEDDSIEKSIVRFAECSRKDYSYLERKTRRCMRQWLREIQH